MAINGSGAKGPVEFAEKVLGTRLWPMQEEILNSIVSSRRVCVRGCHSSGKTYLAACAILWFAARYADSRVLVVGPGWMIVKSVLWQQIHSLLAGALVRLPLDVRNLTEIRLNRSLILGISTNDPQRLQGHHARHIFVVVDESPAIPAEYFAPLEGLLSGGDARILLLGNPVSTGGFFFDAFNRNRHTWRCFSISAFSSPNLAGLDIDSLLALPDDELDRNPWPFLATRRWVRERHSEWFNGDIMNSPLWASRVLAEFPSASANQLIPFDWLRRAQRPPIDTGSELIVGIDCAGAGRDKTAAVVCCGCNIIASRTWSDADARPAVIEWLRPYASRIRLIRYDSSGLGYFFSDPLIRAGYRCEPVNVSSAPHDRERYVNLKAEAFWLLRMHFERDEVAGLSDEMLAELSAVQWLVDPRGKTAIESKESVRSTLGHSPDLGEALMLVLGQHFEVPRMILAPSTSWQNAPYPGQYRDGCREQDDLEDNIYGATGIMFAKRPRSKWDSM